MGSAPYIGEEGRIQNSLTFHLVLNKWTSCEYEDSIYQRLMLLHKVSIVAAYKTLISSLRKCNHYLKLYSEDITNFHGPLLQWYLFVIVLAS